MVEKLRHPANGLGDWTLEPRSSDQGLMPCYWDTESETHCYLPDINQRPDHQQQDFRITAGHIYEKLLCYSINQLVIWSNKTCYTTFTKIWYITWMNLFILMRQWMAIKSIICFNYSTDFNFVFMWLCYQMILFSEKWLTLLLKTFWEN